MAAPFIARGAQADGTDYLRHHIVGVFLMGLNIGTKFELNMLAIIEIVKEQR